MGTRSYPTSTLSGNLAIAKVKVTEAVFLLAPSTNLVIFLVPMTPWSYMLSTISSSIISTKLRWEATLRHEFMDTGIEASISISCRHHCFIREVTCLALSVSTKRSPLASFFFLTLTTVPIFTSITFLMKEFTVDSRVCVLNLKLTNLAWSGVMGRVVVKDGRSEPSFPLEGGWEGRGLSHGVHPLPTGGERDTSGRTPGSQIVLPNHSRGTDRC